MLRQACRNPEPFPHLAPRFARFVAGPVHPVPSRGHCNPSPSRFARRSFLFPPRCRREAGRFSATVSLRVYRNPAALLASPFSRLCHNKLFSGDFMRHLLFVLAIAGCVWGQAPTPPAAPAQGAPAPAAAPLPDGLYAIMTTGVGVIKVKLFEKETPNTVKNFVALAEGKKAWADPKTKAMVRKPMYNNITFHRVMMDGMIQSGDPTGTSEHMCGVHIKDEMVPTLKFDQPGRLAMANTGDKDSGGCQWFITALRHIRAGGRGTGSGEADLAHALETRERAGDQSGQADQRQDRAGWAGSQSAGSA